MNTLRPEWNDANNALVGYGASMVTLCYMRRYVAFLQTLVQTDVQVGAETLDFLRAIRHAYMNGNRKQFTDIVGTAGEKYRAKVYAGLSGESEVLELSELQEFCAATLRKIDESIRANKRADGLYEAYNLIRFTENTIEVSHLYETGSGALVGLVVRRRSSGSVRRYARFGTLSRGPTVIYAVSESQETFVPGDE